MFLTESAATSQEIAVKRWSAMPSGKKLHPIWLNSSADAYLAMSRLQSQLPHGGRSVFPGCLTYMKTTRFGQPFSNSCISGSSYPPFQAERSTSLGWSQSHPNRNVTPQSWRTAMYSGSSTKASKRSFTPAYSTNTRKRWEHRTILIAPLLFHILKTSKTMWKPLPMEPCATYAHLWRLPMKRRLLTAW